MNRLKNEDFRKFNECLLDMLCVIEQSTQLGETKEGTYKDICDLSKVLNDIMKHMMDSDLGDIIVRRANAPRPPPTILSLEQKYARVGDDYVKCRYCETPIKKGKRSMRKHLQTGKCRERRCLKTSGLVANSIGDKKHEAMIKMNCMLHRKYKEKQQEEESKQELEEELIEDSDDEPYTISSTHTQLTLPEELEEEFNESSDESLISYDEVFKK